MRFLARGIHEALLRSPILSRFRRLLPAPGCDVAVSTSRRGFGPRSTKSLRSRRARYAPREYLGLGLSCEQTGTVFAEFLLSFLPIFLLFLSTIQLSLIYAAHLVVQHAAVRAVRAASLTLDDDPCFHRGEARGVLPVEGQANTTDAALKLLGLLGVTPSSSSPPSRGGLKLQRVRRAAYLPLSVLAPTPSQMATLFPWSAGASTERQSVAASLGTHPGQRIVGGLVTYNRVAAALSFPVAPNASEVRSLSERAYGPDEPITLRVTYLFSCDVPLARELLCRSLLDMLGLGALGASVEALRGAPSLQVAEERGRMLYARLKSAGGESERLRRELSESEWKWLLPALAGHSNRFAVLRGEASLPNQGATYAYPSELGKARCDGMSWAGGAS